MTLRTLLDLSPKTVLEFFEWDAGAIGDFGGILRWHPGTTVTDDPVVWQGNTYVPMPIQGEGWEMTSSGKLPRPILRVANIGGVIGAYLRQYKDGINAKVTRRRTLKQFIDAVNFPGGVNPLADPSAQFPPDVFYVARKASENPIFVELELATKPDVESIFLPRRQVIAGTCQWIYRDPSTCTYAGAPVYNDPVFPGFDRCGKTLTSCKRRFGEYGTLMTSAFPASMLLASQ